MAKMRPIRKRSFLLLELVISLALIMLCLFPLLRPNLQLYQLSKKRLAASENFSKNSLLLCKIKRELFEAKYSWEELKKGISTPEYSMKAIEKTEREAFQREGLLLEVTTAFGKHEFYVERAL